MRHTAPQRAIPTVEVDRRAELTQQLRDHSERSMERLREHSEAPSPPPSRDAAWHEQLLWGLAQPGLGLRVLLRERGLQARAIGPVAAFVLICGVVALGSEAVGVWGWLTAYYGTLIAAAPLSPILFARSYAKIAAEARPLLGHTPHEPYLRSYWQSTQESVAQLILVGAGAAPFVALASQLPLLGAILGWSISAAWALHWIVIEAFDSARTLAPGDTVAALELRHADIEEPPWYSAASTWQLRRGLRRLTGPVRWWGGFMARLGRRWRGEVALIEQRPWLATGFGVGAAALLTIPVINLLFRPAVVIAASHVLGHLDSDARDHEDFASTDLPG